MFISVIIALIGILLSIFRERESIKKGNTDAQSASLKDGSFNFSFSISITLIVFGFGGSFISNKYLPDCADNGTNIVEKDSIKEPRQSDGAIEVTDDNKKDDKNVSSTKPAVQITKNVDNNKNSQVSLREIPAVDLNNIYDFAIKYSEDLYKVKKGDFWGLVRSSGKIIAPIKYNKIESLNQGLAIFNIELEDSKMEKMNDYFGAFNEDGLISIEPKYLYLKIQCGIIRASRRSSTSGYGYYCGLLNLSGEEMFDFEQRDYSHMGDCCNNSFPVSQGVILRGATMAWGAIDISGKILFPANYSLDEIREKLNCK